MYFHFPDDDCMQDGRNVDYSVFFDADQSLRYQELPWMPSHVVNILYFNDFPFPKSWKFAKCRAIGAVTLTVNIPPVAGKLPKFNIVKMLISPLFPGGRGAGVSID
jgi:hypothetical protein